MKWHRTYDPSLGRYLQSDPIGLAGGLNRYAYVGGNPVGWVDPTGEVAITFGGELSGSIAGFGGGGSAKVGVSLTRDRSGKLKFQAGALGGLMTNPNAVAAGASDLELGQRLGNLVLSLADTGLTGVFEVGFFTGTECNPADLDDLVGRSTETGIQAPKPGKLKSGLRGAQKVINRFTPGAVSADIVSGNGISGIELGAGIGSGFGHDIGITAGKIWRP